jgi:hypothetical protein
VYSWLGQLIQHGGFFLRNCSAAAGLAGFNFTLEQIRTTLAQIPPREILLLEEIPG